MSARFWSQKRPDQDAVHLFLRVDGRYGRLTKGGLVWDESPNPFLTVPGRLWDVPAEFELPED